MLPSTKVIKSFKPACLIIFSQDNFIAFKDEFKILDFVEIHETTKKDAPSGTAKMLAEILGVNESKIQSLRLNYAPATHELIFYSEAERITLKHEIFNKMAFVIGLIEEIKKYGVGG